MPGNPILLFNAARSNYRPILMAEGEHYNTPRREATDSGNITYRPPGRYDSAALIQSMTGECFDPSIVICQWCCEGSSEPYNLAPIKCPKVLIVGDTHHTPSPLTRSIRLALSEPWDLVVLEFNERHLKWFHEAGVKQAVYIPCWSISPIDIPVPAKRTRGVTFCGSLGPDHVYRRRVLGALRERGIKIEVFHGTRAEVAKIYNESLVSLNISLNGDFNLRNYEIAAAGGCMVSEKYPFDVTDIKGMASTIHFYLQEKESLDRGKFLYKTYLEGITPTYKIKHLWDALDAQKGREVKTMCDLHKNTAPFWYRLAIYEKNQEFVMRGQVNAADFDDLPRWVV